MNYTSLSILFLLLVACNSNTAKKEPTEKIDSTQTVSDKKAEAVWVAPDTATIPHDAFGAAVRYGRDLILNTSYYIGPEGIAGKYLGNKMNCTNCHLEAGTVPYAFNYASSHARYPQYRPREDKILSLSERVNNCIERPHNGKPLPLDSKEMTAIICYIKWLGQGSTVNEHVKGDSPIQLVFPDRAADPEKGKAVYIAECQSCHGENGEGKMKASNVCYEYPPLWGLKSYKPGSSLHRVVKAATFIYCNMPYKKASYSKPYLSIEQAFDVAAFINDDRIHERPANKKGEVSYPNIKTKPLDYGSGPYIDSFPELQHKFGPYQPIVDWRKANNLPTNF